MGNLTLAGATSGQVTISPPAVAGTNTLSLPAATGTLIYGTQPTGTIVGTTDTQTLTNKTLTSPTINTPVMGGSVLTSGTAQASTSGTAITFTGIPSWAKRITIMLQGVQTSSTSSKIVQLGTAGGFVTSGYLGSGFSSPNSTNFTSGFGVYTGASTQTVHGNLMITNLTSNTWTASGSFGLSDVAAVLVTGGSISAASLGGVLTQVRVTTVNGTDTFTAGNINILYE